MSWKGERIMSLSAHVIVITFIAVIAGAGVGTLFGETLVGTLIGLSVGVIHFLLGYLVIRELARYRESVEKISARCTRERHIKKP